MLHHKDNCSLGIIHMCSVPSLVKTSSCAIISTIAETCSLLSWVFLLLCECVLLSKAIGIANASTPQECNTFEQSQQAFAAHLREHVNEVRTRNDKNDCYDSDDNIHGEYGSSAANNDDKMITMTTAMATTSTAKMNECHNTAHRLMLTERFTNP